MYEKHSRLAIFDGTDLEAQKRNSKGGKLSTGALFFQLTLSETEGDGRSSLKWLFEGVPECE